MADLEQLLPDSEQVDPEQAYGKLDLSQLAGSTGVYLVANMVSSADGSATLAGKSAGISSDVDRKLFHVLRTQVDAVMAGTTTIEKENYGPLIPGASEQPLAVTVTRNMDLPLESRLFQDPGSKIVVITNCEQPLPEAPAELVAIRTPGETVDFGNAFEQLRSDHGVRTMLLEGGPTMLGIVAESGQLDELFMTLSPLLAGGGIGPRIVEGPALPDPIRLTVKSVLASESSLFLRYKLDADD